MAGWSRRSAGPSGELRRGYAVAAELGAWDIAPSGIVGQDDPEGPWSMVAEVRERADFWLGQGGTFDLLLTDMAGRTLTVRGVDVMNDEKIGVRHRGAPEVTDG